MRMKSEIASAHRSDSNSLSENLSAAQKFSVNLRQFLQILLKFCIRGDSSARLLYLAVGFEQKFHRATRVQGLDEVMKRPMLMPPLAAAIGFAAREILGDTGSSHQVRRDRKTGENPSFALSQGSGRGISHRKYLSHKKD